jgi:DNA polymerase-3 subunit alpha
MISSLRPYTQKNGKQMAFGVLEDFEGTIELLVFADVYEKFSHELAPDVMVLVHGEISLREGEEKPKLRVERVLPLAEARERLVRSVHIRLNTQGLEPEFVAAISEECKKNPGECVLVIHLVTQESNEYSIKARQFKVNAAHETVETLRLRLGKENVWISKVAA